MAKKPEPLGKKTDLLFDLGMPVPAPPEFQRLKKNICTEHKSKLIATYLDLFVDITKHGAYIDGFAGPQEEKDEAKQWSAKLVLESRAPRSQDPKLRPPRLTKFFLFDSSPEQIERLNKLKREQPFTYRNQRRVIEIKQGDFNVLLPKLLASRPIRENEATFALLDQRTFQCEWRSVEALAKYKKVGQYKIELFYFLPIGWLDRSIVATTKNMHMLEAWWGRPDYNILRDLNSKERADLFQERISTEFKYKYVMPYPIFKNENGGGGVMYYMIHATDHSSAPELMIRAYNQIVRPPKTQIKQLELLSTIAKY